LWSLGVEKPPHKYMFEFWWDYTQKCRELASIANVTMRVLDRALWQYSKEYQQKRGSYTNKEKVSCSSENCEIGLPYGGKGSTFHVDDLVSYIRSMHRNYIVQGQVNCRFDEHPKPHSLDYWLRLHFAKNKDTKQAVNNVVNALLDTGLFALEEGLICPDSGHPCKGLRIK